MNAKIIVRNNKNRRIWKIDEEEKQRDNRIEKGNNKQRIKRETKNVGPCFAWEISHKIRDGDPSIKGLKAISYTICRRYNT